MKKLYYTVSIEVDVIDEIFEANGNQTISCYSIQNDTPKREFDIDCAIEGSDVEKIEEYLIDNGMGDEEFEIILL